jgi:pimeloyl-ACP methyl ester carboxylesterase
MGGSSARQRSAASSVVCRLITFDQRGTGASGPIEVERLATWEHWAEDLTAVVDAVDSRRGAIWGEFESLRWGMLFAATCPERTSALVLWNTRPARSVVTTTRSDSPPPEADELTAELIAGWGTPAGPLTAINPSIAADDALVPTVASYARTCCTPSTFGRTFRWEFDIDTRSILPSIRVPAGATPTGVRDAGRGGALGGRAHPRRPRVEPLAEPGEVLASRTVKDLFAGSAIRLVDQGSHNLKGLEEPSQRAPNDTSACADPDRSRSRAPRPIVARGVPAIRQC